MSQRNKAKQRKRTPSYSTDSMIASLILGLVLLAAGVLIFLATVVAMPGDVFEGLRNMTRGAAGAMSFLLAVPPVPRL